MPIVDNIKNVARKAVEATPDLQDIRGRMKAVRPRTLLFKDDGVTPNHPKWPLLVYKGVFRSKGDEFRSGAILDALFASNQWKRSWRASVYSFLHYHSQTHEVLGVASGWARIQFGGVKGRMLKVVAGDVLVLPAGTGHQRFEVSKDFLVVGAYPPGGAYDECTDSRDREKAVGSIRQVNKPKADPIFGVRGPLAAFWKR